MSEQVQRDINCIVDTLKKYEEIEAIYLFGSYAYGEPTSTSDLDVAILSNDKNTRIVDLMDKYGWELLDLIETPMDLLVYYPDVFLDRARTGLTMETTIYNKGKKLYGQV